MRYLKRPTHCVCYRRISVIASRRRISDAGSQYSCGRVGRGYQPRSTSNTPPNTLSNTDTYTKSFKMLVFHFSTHVHGPRTNRPTDRRRDKTSYRVACPQLKTRVSPSTLIRNDSQFFYSPLTSLLGRINHARGPGALK